MYASVYQYTDIPQTVSSAIVSLFSVEKLQDLSASQLRHLHSVYGGFYTQVEETDYTNTCKEYTLKYFPVNFFKIWTPLTDLLEKGQITEQCTVLELGCGPGSSTFGLLEFYRILAESNPDTIFNLALSLVEKELGFLEIFRCIFDQYATCFPPNLQVTYTKYPETIQSFFAQSHREKYHLIIESNLFNPNEKVTENDLYSHCTSLQQMLLPHSSIVMIEPAKDGLKDYLYRMKSILLEMGLFVFSPCRCEKAICKAFAVAQVNTRGISITSYLRSKNLVSGRYYHYFEYLICRNDSLIKHELRNNDGILNSLSSALGKTIQFDAYILGAFDRDDHLDLKICDGSCDDRQIVVHVPKQILTDDSICALSIGRGGAVRVKGGKVVSSTEIDCLPSTRISIM